MKLLVDSDVARDRTTRALFAISVAVIVPILAAVFGSFFLTTLIDFPSVGGLGFILGLGAGGIFVAAISRYFIVQNPPEGAFITQNPFSYADGGYVLYGPGWHFAFPWEQRQKKGNFFLGLSTEQITESVPALDGEVIANISVQVLVRDPIALYKSTVESGVAGLRDAAREWLSTRLAAVTVDDAVLRVNQLSTELDVYLRQQSKAQLVSTFGLEVVNSRVQSIDLGKRIQAARDTEDQARAIIRSMTTVLGYSTPDEMFRDVRSGKLTTRDMRAVREDVLAMAGVLRPNISRLDLSGIDARDSAAAAAIFAAINEL